MNRRRERLDVSLVTSAAVLPLSSAGVPCRMQATARAEVDVLAILSEGRTET